jgi:D-alanine-D-alanine ligase
MTHTHVALLFGGRSGEHEISLRSARSVVDAIDRSAYRLTLVGIDRQGRWRLLDETTFRQLTDRPFAALVDEGTEVTFRPVPGAAALIDPRHGTVLADRIDAVFPALHGPHGEDGTVQGLFELAEVAYVGAGVLGSAVGMDKDVQKRLLQAAGLPVVPWRTITPTQWAGDCAGIMAAVRPLGLPLFVKPANLGSSVGVSKVRTFDALAAAVAAAFDYDVKVIIETGVDAREIECAVLGNEEPEASVPGEICPRADFYSYEAKYVDDRGAELRIPAPLSTDLTATVQALAVHVFRVLECTGLARVDFFLERRTDRLFVNEINTLPGFTSISMYPKLWAASGLAYPALIDRLIALALERHAQRQKLRTEYRPRS